MGKIAEAEVVAKSVIKGNPNNGRTFMLLANAAQMKKQIERSIRYVRKAIEASPSELSYQEKLCDLLERTGNKEESDRIAVKIFQALPGNKWVTLRQKRIITLNKT